MRRRRGWRDFAVVVWAVMAVLVSLAHVWIPSAAWLLIHLVGLGIITHSIMVWSAYFTASLLKTRPDETAVARQNRRLGLLALGSAAVFVGVPTVQWWLVVSGVVVVSLMVLWHAGELIRDLRRALPMRFRIVVRYYIASAACMPIGAGFGAALAWGLGDAWHSRLLIAHTMTMLLGWVGLTVVGTLVTFWPTVLRTRMDQRSERLARQALPILLVAVTVTVTAALLGWRPVAVGGLGLYALGLLWWGRSLVGPARQRPPREFASASIAAAMVWFTVAGLATGWAVLRLDDLSLAEAYPRLGAIWAVGFLVQLVTGAMTYLLPSVLGGGPRVLKAGSAWLERYGAARLTVINLGLAVWLLPVPSWVKVTTSVVVLAALAAFLPLMVLGIKAAVTERKTMAMEAAQGKRPHVMAERPGGAQAAAQARSGVAAQTKTLTGSGVTAGATAVLLAVTVGIGVDLGAAGLQFTGTQSVSGQTQVEPTGNTVRLEIDAVDMAFTPNQATVNAGDHVIIELTNTDPTNIHDLQIGGQRTERLRAGQTGELDLGVVSESMEGWCTVAGHRQMGMTFNLTVEAATDSGGLSAQNTDDDASEATMNGMEHGSHSTDAGVSVDPEASLESVVDPVLSPVESGDGEGADHQLRLEVTEQPMEVAPGVWQQRWTYNGSTVGPTLHGKIGDTFEITLVNNGTMGHSVDFHAGEVAPDQNMRTIAPGEELTYRFTANRAGIWMYHCSTAPMSAHIAGGMHGAVIIEPEDLQSVDREYVLVQSEVYLDGDGASKQEARPVDAEAAGSGAEPTFVVFNGAANQYDQEPLEARVGERVRVWVLDAGPNRPLSFHIVGDQFDTVFVEGAYTLRDGVDPFGVSGGGSQALGLEAAQGGFVELTFDEPGHFPMVNHVMVDAERGAHGVFRVTE